nr:hypothetical protein [Tanacetum cinerariifolium]
MFVFLCYPTNDRDDLGKMKPKADIGILVGYCESSRRFHIYNCENKKIMETVHVKFDELTTMAFECDNLEPRMNYTNFNDSSKDSQSLPSTSDLDNLFGPMYEEYYVTSSQEVSDNFTKNTLDNDHTSSSSSIIVDKDDAPPIVVFLEEQVVIKPNSLVLNEDPSNMHQFHQQHRLIDRWTKNHPLEQVIGDPLKLVMTRKRHQTDAKVCIYALTDSGYELIAYADADHAGCNDDCKITSRGIHILGDNLVSWSSKKQDYTAMSSAKAEMKYQLADLFTKALPKERFEFLVHKIGM